MHISLIESTAYEWWWKMCPCWKAIYSVTAGGIYFALWTYIDSVYCSVDFSLPPPLFILCLLKSFHPAASYISQHSMKESEKKVECSLMFLYCSLCTDSMEIFSSSSSSSYFASSPSVSGSTARGLIKRDQVDPNCRRTVPYRAEPFRSARASEP